MPRINFVPYFRDGEKHLIVMCITEKRKGGYPVGINICICGGLDAQNLPVDPRNLTTAELKKYFKEIGEQVKAAIIDAEQDGGREKRNLN